MALMLHLTSMCQRLPLRILQVRAPLLPHRLNEVEHTDLKLSKTVARAKTSSPAADVHTWVRSWAAEDNGQTARRTAWTAGQLVSLVRNTDTPLEPFALTYAALALVCYCRTAHHGPGAPHPTVALDRLVDRADASVAQWIATGEGDATLEDVGSLTDPAAPEKLLRVCGERLLSLNVWRVGELLGRTLILLADESGGDEVCVKEEA